MTERKQHWTVIPGPCAVESMQQMEAIMDMADQVGGISALRTDLDKPRTYPKSFRGLGTQGLDILSQVAQRGYVPATEVLTVGFARTVINRLEVVTPEPQVLFWLGARNQNQEVQMGLGELVARVPGAKLIIKNPMWEVDMGESWRGAVLYAMEGMNRAQNPDPNKIIICHRGIAKPNDLGYRNIPDTPLALSVRDDLSAKLGTRLSLLLDPSHSAGRSPENVMNLTMQSGGSYDGILIEVHPNPPEAQSDNDQQLTPHQFIGLMEQIPRPRVGV